MPELLKQKEELLSVAQVADYLKVSKKTIYTWSHKKAIPVLKLSRKMIRFRKSDIDYWIHQKIHKHINKTNLSA